MIKKENLFLLVAIYSIAVLALTAVSAFVTSPTSFNFNDSSTNFYKINITNDALDNITAVRISLPSGFGYISGESDSGVSVSQSGNNLTWSGLNISTNEENYFAFSATNSEIGSSSLTITVTNSSGDYSSTINVVINDTTAPTINYLSPENNPNYTMLNYTLFKINASDRTQVDRITLKVYNASGYLLDSNSSIGYSFVYLNISELNEGIYYYNVSVNDSLNNSYAEQRSFYVDWSAPTIDLSESVTQTTADIDIAITDVSGIGSQCNYHSQSPGEGSSDNPSSPWDNDQTATVSGLTCGTTYTYSVSCTDKAGNSKTESNSFTTSACDSSGSSSDGGSDSSDSSDNVGDYSGVFWIGNYILTDVQFDLGANKMLKERNRFEFKINGETHHVGIMELTSTEATINVSSDSQEATLDIGEERAFEVNSDGYYDVRVKLIDINSSDADYTANITVQYMHEKVPESENTALTNTDSLASATGETTADESADSNETGLSGFGKTLSGMMSKVTGGVSVNLPEFMSNRWFWIGIGAAVLIIGGGIYFVRKEDNISGKVKMVDKNVYNEEPKEENSAKRGADVKAKADDG